MRQLPAELIQRGLAPDQAGSGKIGSDPLPALHWSHEAIARAIHRLDVVFAEGASQRRDMDFEVGRLDDTVRPDARQNLVPADGLASMIEQCCQYLECAASQAYRGVAVEE